MRTARLRAGDLLAPVVGALAGAIAALNVRLALGALVAAIAAVVVFIGTEFLLLAVVASEPWADMLHYPSATVSIPKIVGILTVASWILKTTTGRGQLRFTAQMGWALAFLFVIVLSLMLSPDPAAGVIKAISYGLYVMFLALFVQLFRGQEKIERCLMVYAGSATFAAGDGLIRFASGRVHLASGPVGDPNDFAMMLSSAIPMAVYFAFNAGRLRWVWKLASVILGGATLLTLSRGAAVGFVAVVVWAVASRRASIPGVLVGGFLVVVVLVTALIFFQPLIQERLVQKSVVANQNVTSREAFWSAAWRMSIDHPVFGVGPQRFGVESHNYVVNDPIVLSNPVVHNSYLEILAEDGPFALALFAAFLASAWAALRKVRALALQAADRRGRRLTDALMASFVWTAFSMAFVSRQLSIPIWLISGMTGSLLLAWRETAARSG